MRREELEACRRQDAVFVTSLRDKEILDHDVPDIPKYVVPNGVDMSYFTPSQTTPEPYTLVFTGMMAYVPNYDGMLYFLDEILPRIHRRMPGVRLYIVGNRPPPDLLKRASDRVVVTGYVDDVRPFIHKASVYVVPLRMGSGTRLKILEAMAMKTPIVTTSIGCEGIDVQDGVSVRIEDEPEGFADAVVDLLGNAALRETLIRNGYELVSSRYDWPIIHKTADALYQRLIEGNTVHGPARSVVQYAR
jgi:glycosyltransferase involved in cell wall biosynthesis